MSSFIFQSLQVSKRVLEVFGFFSDLGKVKGYLLPDMTH